MRKRRRTAPKSGQRTRPRGAARRASIDTKESLLDAAERLFAAHGLHAVTLRVINAAAGARNASAAHYHFRSRASLLRAVARRRMDQLSEQRLAALRVLERRSGKRPPEVRAVVEAVTLPILRMLLDDNSGGANYVRFLAHAAVDPSIQFSDLATESFNFVFMTVLNMLRPALPYVPVPVLTERMTFGFDVGVLAPLRISRLARRADGSLDRAAVEVFAARLIDYVTGALSAPVSNERVRLSEPAGLDTGVDSGSATSSADPRARRPAAAQRS